MVVPSLTVLSNELFSSAHAKLNSESTSLAVSKF